ncbi:glycosyltransferase family 2 protein [Donghicola sp.]|uniref:glycosyltransferase family 2 protein n=1 Tax=Donghicola sp. TaxID=1929294 RepID=UPI0025CDC6E1|nr:glycosyltransferase family A protein [Donghicola sp.]MCT4579583.1 glycosyltransferase family 2 protein [Donghicola sp.]
MNITLVIPTKNDAINLFRLLNMAEKYEIFEKIIVVDDGSYPKLQIPAGFFKNVKVLRNEESQGPGLARNAGLHQVETSHVLFFDSDDCLTEEIEFLWLDLRYKDFDFCIFRHADSRSFPAGLWHQMSVDDFLWAEAKMGGLALEEIDIGQAAILSGTANYPWNKIYRTDFLRENDIYFPNISVHEDVLPHWQSFIKAKSVLASDRIAAVHYVLPGTCRQTNREDADRLLVFETLISVWCQLICKLDDAAVFKRPFLKFCISLIDWMHGSIEDQHKEALRKKAKNFLDFVMTEGSPYDLQMISVDHLKHYGIRINELGTDKGNLKVGDQR